MCDSFVGIVYKGYENVYGAKPHWSSCTAAVRNANENVDFPKLGWVAERFNAPVLKTGVRVTVPWVRIPPHPLKNVDQVHLEALGSLSGWKPVWKPCRFFLPGGNPELSLVS